MICVRRWVRHFQGFGRSKVGWFCIKKDIFNVGSVAYYEEFHIWMRVTNKPCFSKQWMIKEIDITLNFINRSSWFSSFTCVTHSNTVYEWLKKKTSLGLTIIISSKRSFYLKGVNSLLLLLLLLLFPSLEELTLTT